jgi:hypothetical protein
MMSTDNHDNPWQSVLDGTTTRKALAYCSTLMAVHWVAGGSVVWIATDPADGRRFATTGIFLAAARLALTFAFDLPRTLFDHSAL